MHKQLLERPFIIAIIGKSCSGKTYLAQFLTNFFTSLGLYVHRMISMTTRPARVNEYEGKDYFFVTEIAFNAEKYSGQLIEHAHFRGWQYGVPYSEVRRGYINIGVFNLEGLKSLQKAKDNYTIIPIYLEEKLSTRLRRSYQRERCWKIEYLRRAVADWVDFKNVDKYLRSFHGRYIHLKNSSGVWQQSQAILYKLEKWGILKSHKEGKVVELCDTI